jgi:hypothetical protein
MRLLRQYKGRKGLKKTLLRVSGESWERNVGRTHRECRVVEPRGQFGMSRRENLRKTHKLVKCFTVTNGMTEMQYY